MRKLLAKEKEEEEGRTKNEKEVEEQIQPRT
jgi:hypothetical protein